MIDSHMSVIIPHTVTDAMLTSSTAPETDYTVWAFGTFVAGDKRIMTTDVHIAYECLIGHTSTDATGAPNLNTGGVTPKWMELGPTNKWAMFDNVIGTATAIASPLTVTLLPGSISGLYLGELVGRQAVVTLKDAPDGATAYTRTITLDGTIISSVYDWFFQPYVQQDSVILTDIPFHFASGELTISITATTGSVSCGACKFGGNIVIGNTLYDAESGIIDFSVKTVDSFGRFSVVEGAYANRMNLQVMTEKSEYNRIFRALASTRAKLCVWIATDVEGYAPLSFYGFFERFGISVKYPTMHLLSIDIQGVNSQ